MEKKRSLKRKLCMAGIGVTAFTTGELFRTRPHICKSEIEVDAIKGLNPQT